MSEGLAAPRLREGSDLASRVLILLLEPRLPSSSDPASTIDILIPLTRTLHLS